MFQVFARTTGIGAAAAVAAASCLPKYRRSTAAAEQSGVLGEYDVCVIGGGAVGLVRASLLFYLRFFHLSHFYISHLLLFLFLHNSGLCAWNYGTVSIKDRRCLGKGSRRSSTPNQSQLGRTLKFILLLKYKTFSNNWEWHKSSAQRLEFACTCVIPLVRHSNASSAAARVKNLKGLPGELSLTFLHTLCEVLIDHDSSHPFSILSLFITPATLSIYYIMELKGNPRGDILQTRIDHGKMLCARGSDDLRG